MVTNYIDTCSVWPGDTDNNNIVDNNDLLPIGLYYYKSGPARSSISNAWQPYSASSWGVNQLNSNIKHVDSDGNSFIDLNDTVAISSNFSFAHALAPPNNIIRTSDPNMYFVTNSLTYTSGSTVDVELWLGNTSLPVSNLYGISFDINYNNAIVQPSTAGVSYPTSWLGTIGNDAIKVSKINESTGIAYGAMSRITNNNVSGYGKIADFKFQVNSNITSIDSLHISISSYKAIDNGDDKTFLRAVPITPDNENLPYNDHEMIDGKEEKIVRDRR